MIPHHFLGESRTNPNRLKISKSKLVPLDDPGTLGIQNRDRFGSLHGSCASHGELTMFTGAYWVPLKVVGHKHHMFLRKIHGHLAA